MNKERLAWMTIVVLGAAGSFAIGTMQAGDDKAAVTKATRGFYGALNKMFAGDVGPMKTIWSHADDVTYMGPDKGYRTGWSDVLANWEAQAAKKLGGRVKPTKLHVFVGTDLAVTQCIERGQNNVDGEPQDVTIRATNVFRKENGMWKMVSHHTDILDFL